MITRNNYEEFFLLYVDNELSRAEKEAVERFVGENPDLKEEWELLMQCRIRPDEAPVFAGKELLRREEVPSLINAGNYETWFLSYIDGELDEPARQAVNDFIRRHPDKNIELQRLQRTVNIPDRTIVFPGKDALRRREKRRIIWMPFARIAAAALVLGAIGLVIFHPFRKRNTPPVVITRSALPVMPDMPSAALTDTPSAALTDATPPTQRTVNVPPEEKTNAVQPVVKKHLAAVTPGTADTLHLYKSKQPDNEVLTEPVLAKADLPVPNVRPSYNEPPVRSETIANVKVPPAVNAPIGNIEPSNKMAVPDPKASFATQALLSQTVAYTDDGSSEETTPPKKNKLRGIFRKVTRALEKPASRQDDDDRKVLIGGFQFALQ